MVIVWSVMVDDDGLMMDSHGKSCNSLMVNYGHSICFIHYTYTHIIRYHQWDFGLLNENTIVAVVVVVMPSSKCYH